MMRQVKIISVEGSYLITSDGSMVFPCGNKVFNPGDYAWVNGNVAFGNTPSGGSSIIIQNGAKIPVVSWKNKNFAFGYIEGGKYIEVFSMDNDENSYGIFVNNASKAYYLKFSLFPYVSIWATSNPDKDIGEQYNLLTGKMISNINGVPLNAEIDDDGNLLFAIWKSNYLLWRKNMSWDSAYRTDADVKIYKNGELLYDCTVAVRSLVAKIEDELKALAGDNLVYANGSPSFSNEYVKIRNCSINKDGSCSLYVRAESSATILLPEDQLDDIRLSGDININMSVTGAFDFVFCSNWGTGKSPNAKADQQSGSFIEKGFTVQSKPFNQFGRCTEEYYIVDDSGKTVASIEKTVASSNEVYEWTISAVESMNDAVYVACYGAYEGVEGLDFVYKFCSLYRSTAEGQSAVVDGRYINNTRFAKMLNINTIKANLQKIWKGQDADE